MTRIKLCGLKRPCDIEYVNELMPDFIGFVFAPKSRRYVTFEEAVILRKKLNDGITPNVLYLWVRRIPSDRRLMYTE